MLSALVALMCTAGGVNGGGGIASTHGFYLVQHVPRVPFRTEAPVLGLRLKGGGEELSSAEAESSVVSSEDDDDENEEAREAEARAAAAHREGIAAAGVPHFHALCVPRPQVIACGGTPVMYRSPPDSFVGWCPECTHRHLALPEFNWSPQNEEPGS
jgi:hypothetical protein